MEDLENKNVRWYVLKTVTGHENVAKQNLETVIRKNPYLQDRIFEIVIPMEDYIEEKDGKKVLKQRKAIPGYLIVKMIYGDDLWHDVTRTPSITGFVGPNARAEAISEDEVRRLRLETIKIDNPDLAIGDKVEIMDGSFSGIVATVESVDMTKNTCRVKMDMFGRENIVELDMGIVKKF